MIIKVLVLFAVDAVFHDRTGAKGDDTARGDHDFNACFGVASDALAFVTQCEMAEAGEFYIFAVFKSDANQFKKIVHQLRGF